MRLPEHEYIRPDNLDECLAALQDAGESSQIVAGGTDVIFNMHLKLFRPETVISVRRLPELSRVEVLSEGPIVVTVGAIAAAVSNAVGEFIPDMPMTPWKVLRIIRQREIAEQRAAHGRLESPAA